MSDITLLELFQAGAHFGHQKRFWNPKMVQYIFGVKQKIHIINLEKTIPLFKEALNFLTSVAAKKGRILFVGTKPAAQEIMREEAVRCGMPYVNHRWLGGMLTNYKTVRQSIKYLKALEAKRDDTEEFSKMSKKDALLLMRELSKMEKNLGGIKDMGGLPDAIFVIDVGHEKTAVTEARKLKIPVIALVDTNRDPTGIDYIIPANDDSAATIKLFATKIADAISEIRSKLPAEEKVVEKDTRRGPKKGPMKPKKKVVTKRAEPRIEQAGAEVSEETVEAVNADQAEAMENLESTDVAEETVATEKTEEQG